jgi:aspartate-semialdehyde dehydrogenase
MDAQGLAQDARIPVAVLGATGSVGQRFLQLLANHPWFRVAEITASDRSAGKPYAEAVDWYQDVALPPEIARLVVRRTDPAMEPLTSPILFSALDAAVADQVETPFAAAGHCVVSNARSHRMDAGVPLMVPEVNAEHLALLDRQPFAMVDGRRGGLIANPNCSTIGLTLALKPLHDAFGLEAVHVVTMQAVSGAGLPGVPSMAILDNLVPFIGGEEEKLEQETLKILGRLDGEAIVNASIRVGAACNRVPVIDGHTECVSVKLARPATHGELRAALEAFRGEPQRLQLPSAPAQPIHFLEANDRPQPRLDRNRDGGMATTIGRLRPCPLFDYKFVLLSHNTLRGAAGGSILVAELALAQGRIPGLHRPA